MTPGWEVEEKNDREWGWSESKWTIATGKLAFEGECSRSGTRVKKGESLRVKWGFWGYGGNGGKQIDVSRTGMFRHGNALLFLQQSKHLHVSGPVLLGSGRALLRNPAQMQCAQRWLQWMCSGRLFFPGRGGQDGCYWGWGERKFFSFTYRVNLTYRSAKSTCTKYKGNVFRV